MRQINSQINSMMEKNIEDEYPESPTSGTIAEGTSNMDNEGPNPLSNSGASVTEKITHALSLEPIFAAVTLSAGSSAGGNQEYTLEGTVESESYRLRAESIVRAFSPKGVIHNRIHVKAHSAA